MRKNLRQVVAWLQAQWRSGAWKTTLLLQLEIRPYLQAVPYVLAAILVGVVAVLYSSLFSSAVQFMQRLEREQPYLLLVTSPICFALASVLVTRFAPNAGGTGVPQVGRALTLDPQSQDNEIYQILNFRVALVVAASSLLAILGCGSLGREGPMVHIAACIFYMTGRYFQRLWPRFEHRSWIVAGGAAGIAAAFNAPLAGVVFVLEELSQQHFHRFKTVVLWAAIVAGVVSQGMSGRYLFLGYPRIGEVPLSSLPWALLVGFIVGLIAFPFHVMTSPKFQQRFKGYFKTKTAIAFAVGLLTAGLALVLHPGNLGGGIHELNELLLDGKRADWALILTRFLGTTISAMAGTAGGFLAPSLALGAAVGSKIADLTSYGGHNLLVLVGMSAGLSAVIGAPFTAWVIVMEMTDRHSAIFPLMVASLTSYATVRWLGDWRVRARVTRALPPPASPIDPTRL